MSQEKLALNLKEEFHNWVWYPIILFVIVPDLYSCFNMIIIFHTCYLRLQIIFYLYMLYKTFESWMILNTSSTNTKVSEIWEIKLKSYNNYEKSSKIIILRSSLYWTYFKNFSLISINLVYLNWSFMYHLYQHKD